MSNSGSARRSKWTLLSIVMLLGSALYLNLIQWALIRDATLSQLGGSARSVTLPASFRPGDYRVSFTLYFLPLASRSFTLNVDDCALSMSVGDQKISNSPIPFCDFTRGRTIDVEGLHYGANKIEIFLDLASNGPGRNQARTRIERLHTTKQSFLRPHGHVVLAPEARAAWPHESINS